MFYSDPDTFRVLDSRERSPFTGLETTSVNGGLEVPKL